MNIVFCDIDGTFQELGMEVPAVNFEAVTALKKQGDHFVFISGRGYDQLDEILSQIEGGCDVIFSNGAGYCLQGKQPVYREWLSLEQSKTILEVLEERNIFYHIHTDKGIILKSVDDYKKNIEELREKLAYMGDAGKQIMDFKENFFRTQCQHVADPYDYLCENPSIKILKIELMEASDEEHLYLREHLSSEETYVFSSFIQCLEVVNPLSSKGHAIEYFMKEYPNAKSYGIGDGENDLAMLEVVDVPIAVKNAKEMVKEKCQLIIDSCEMGGVGKFIFDQLIQE